MGTNDQQYPDIVILADDDPDDRHLFEAALKAINPSILLIEVKDGQELLTLLQHLQPDLIFLDLDMPVVHGLECLKKIKEHPSYTDLPVIVFSSTTRSSGIHTAYELGTDLFFIKPSTFTELTRALKALLTMDWSNPLNVKQQYHIGGQYVAFH